MHIYTVKKGVCNFLCMYFIVTTSLSCTIFQIFDVKNIVTLKSWLAVTQPAWSVQCSNLRTLGCVFPADWKGPQLHSLIHSELQKKLYMAIWCVTVIQGHSRSQKLVPIENQYAISYWSSVVSVTCAYLVSFPSHNELLIESLHSSPFFSHRGLSWNSQARGVTQWLTIRNLCDGNDITKVIWTVQTVLTVQLYKKVIKLNMVQ